MGDNFEQKQSIFLLNFEKNCKLLTSLEIESEDFNDPFTSIETSSDHNAIYIASSEFLVVLGYSIQKIEILQKFELQNLLEIFCLKSFGCSLYIVYYGEGLIDEYKFPKMNVHVLQKSQITINPEEIILKKFENFSKSEITQNSDSEIS